MEKSEFCIGDVFYFENSKYQCTDIGSRVVTAIRRGPIQTTVIEGDGTETTRSLSEQAAEAAGWFNGPPYAVSEQLFDEYDQRVCHTHPSDGD